ncbi:MAG: glycosyltransferase family 4 protein [Candidatus Sungbacteria bacterium]|nr:glycosyltransferase family 4 protein [Candidatus Sungbacteria bacterium]
MLKKIYWAYKNKIANKLFGVVRMPAQGKKKGDVLLSYITEPFTHAPWEPLSNFHTMYWECYETARLLSEKGYGCDIVNALDNSFIPRKPYRVCIDSENNLERFLPHLPKNCIKVFFIFISHWEAYNTAEESRLADLEKRRGVRLVPRRKVKSSRNAEIADCIIGFGNKTVFNTFHKFKKTIFYIPISSVIQFDSPEKKDFASARNHFTWMGGGGAVLKGLDITLEAFSKMPDFHLHVCGPVSAEKDFVREYKKELEETPNIHVYGRIDVTGSKFSAILNRCSAVVYPSAGEGSSGTIVLAMHAGLIPIISHETGIQEDSGYIPLVNSTPESIIKTVTEFSKMPEESMRQFSKKIWAYARTHYTKKQYTAACTRFIEDVLHL